MHVLRSHLPRPLPAQVRFSNRKCTNGPSRQLPFPTLDARACTLRSLPRAASSQLSGYRTSAISALQVHLGTLVVITSMVIFISAAFLPVLAPGVGPVIASFFIAMNIWNVIYASWCILCVSACAMLHALTTRQSSKLIVRSEEDVRVVTNRVKRLTSLFAAPIVAAPKALILEVPEEANVHWKSLVQSLLDVVDTLVIDVSVVTAGIEWEITQLLRLNRPNVIWIADDNSLAPNQDRWAQLFPAKVCRMPLLDRQHIGRRGGGGDVVRERVLELRHGECARQLKCHAAQGSRKVSDRPAIGTPADDRLFDERHRRERYH